VASMSIEPNQTASISAKLLPPDRPTLFAARQDTSGILFSALFPNPLISLPLFLGFEPVFMPI